MVEPRSRPRKSIVAEVQLRRSGELNYVVSAYDLSEDGCKLEFVERPSLGEIVWVKFPGLASIESSVRWVGDFSVGIEFSTRVDSRVLDMLLERLR